MTTTTFHAGIDIGSVMTKCVIIAPDGVQTRDIARTGARAEETAEQVFAAALRKAGLKREQVECVATTGYGRRLFAGAHQVITEISAAATGAFISLGGKSCFVLDVGGQDTKVIEVNSEGQISDFLMNDKCAAGTGRFLEMMAHIFDTDCAGLSALALDADAPVTINSTCSVFAESEVISLIARAARRENIAAGLFAAIAGRIAVMAGHFSIDRPLVFCGGGAKSAALKAALEKAIDLPLIILSEPQFITAFGAALVAGRPLDYRAA